MTNYEKIRIARHDLEKLRAELIALSLIHI